MLSSHDDFPVHQTTFPVAHTATSDINHYDRYFFNGYSADGSVFFAAAMGLYPNRSVADAAFSVVVGGGGPAARQVNVHASRRAPRDRSDANVVGPITVEVVAPLHELRLRVDAPDHGVRALLAFSRRSAPIEEPHFLHRIGARVLLDYTRLTQFGTWSGWLEVDGERIDIAPGTMGSRDRSWGVRPVGERASTGAPVADPQFFWLWAPVNFPAFSTHFDVNELTDGSRWHETGFVVPVDGEPEEMRAVDFRIEWRPGTRAAAAFELDLVPSVGEPTTLTLEPVFDFHMAGIGYTHPEWSHGVWKGEDVAAGDRWTLPVDDPTAPDRVHVQTFARATTRGGLGGNTGVGVLEQFVVGRHAPTGLEGLFDGWSPP